MNKALQNILIGGALTIQIGVLVGMGYIWRQLPQYPATKTCTAGKTVKYNTSAPTKFKTRSPEGELEVAIKRSGKDVAVTATGISKIDYTETFRSYSRAKILLDPKDPKAAVIFADYGSSEAVVRVCKT